MERMEFDIGSLIYILITIVAVIGGIAKKKKKQAGDAPIEEGGSESKSKGGFFGKLEQQLEKFAVDAKGSLEGLTGQSSTNEPEPVELDERDYFEKMSDDYEAIDKNDLRNNFAQYEGLYSPDDEQNFELLEAEGIIVTDGMELSQLDGDQEMSFNNDEVLEGFDARTAIIYSTIINRIEI